MMIVAMCSLFFILKPWIEEMFLRGKFLFNPMGITGALLGRGVPAFDAACAAAFLHGTAGDVAASGLTEHGMLASDLVDLLPATLSDLLEGKDAE